MALVFALQSVAFAQIPAAQPANEVKVYYDYAQCGEDQNKDPAALADPNGVRKIWGWGAKCQLEQCSNSTPYCKEMFDLQELSYRNKYCDDAVNKASQVKEIDQNDVAELRNNCNRMKSGLADFEKAQSTAQNCNNTQDPKTCIDSYLGPVVQLTRQLLDLSSTIDKQKEKIEKALGESSVAVGAFCPECEKAKAANLKAATCCSLLQEREGAQSPQQCEAFFKKKPDTASCVSTIWDTFKNSFLNNLSGLGSIFKAAWDTITDIKDSALLSGIGQLMAELKKSPMATISRIVSAVLGAVGDLIGFPPGYSDCFPPDAQGLYWCQAAGSVSEVLSEAIAGGAIFDLLKGATQTSRVLKLSEKVKLANKDKNVFGKLGTKISSTAVYAEGSVKAAFKRMVGRLSGATREALDENINDMLEKLGAKYDAKLLKSSPPAKTIESIDQRLASLSEEKTRLEKAIEKKGRSTDKKALEVNEARTASLSTLREAAESEYKSLAERYNAKAAAEARPYVAKPAGPVRPPLDVAADTRQTALRNAEADFEASAKKVRDGYSKAADDVEVASRDLSRNLSYNRGTIQGKNLDQAQLSYQKYLHAKREAQHWSDLADSDHEGHLKIPDAEKTKMKNALALPDDKFGTAAKQIPSEVLGPHKVPPLAAKAQSEVDALANELRSKGIKLNAAEEDVRIHGGTPPTPTASAATGDVAAPKLTDKKDIKLAKQAYRDAAESELYSITQIKEWEKARGAIRDNSELTARLDSAIEKQKILQKNAADVREQIASVLDKKDIPDVSRMAKPKVPSGLPGAQSRSGLFGMFSNMGNKIGSVAVGSTKKGLLRVPLAAGVTSRLNDQLNNIDSEGNPPQELPYGAPTDRTPKPFVHSCLPREEFLVCVNRIRYSTWYIVNCKQCMIDGMLQQEVQPPKEETTTPDPATPAPAAASAPAPAAPAPPAAAPPAGSEQQHPHHQKGE